MRWRAAAALALLLCLSCGSSGVDAVATLSPPPVDPRLNVLGQGSLVLDVSGSGKQAIDPLALARAAGQSPDCASFVFLFSWQVDTGPELMFVGSRMGGSFEIGSGRGGQASVEGCILLEARNPGRDPARGALRYFIATPR